MQEAVTQAQDEFPGFAPTPPRKKQLTFRVDTDTAEWLRSQEGYCTRVNSLLRAWMEREKKKEEKESEK